jgi:hypothetical protein
MQDNAFYAAIDPQDEFRALADTGVYTPLPDDWWVGTSDLVGSTQAISAGHYKTVNMIAAAVISAQINAHAGAEFPYIFGGDGAGFAVPPAWKQRAEDALTAVQAWAAREFGMELRVALVPVADIRNAGLDVTVARYRVAADVDYAMFSGGGVAWAETAMKDGAYALPAAPSDAEPDLTGLSCRWSHMPSRFGTILSVVILPLGDTPGAKFARVAEEVVALGQTLKRAGHPAEDIGPGVKWPPAGARLEAHAQRGSKSLIAAQAKALFESFMAWALIKTGITLGGFNARHYRRVVGQNADFRKFDDGLKMTLDCDTATEARLRELLEQAARDGVIRYGLHAQTEAMLTCIVPSIMTDDHVHFVDGASGGYAQAATALKSS